ncbi:AAA family ATPase [Pseudomonas gingeri]
MRSIYLDNYRGFSNQFIPLNSVNFLVGENSTGKTSLLAAIKVLGSPKFWFHPSFDDPNLPFSTFLEIASKASLDKTYFSLGYFNDEFSNQTQEETQKSTFRILRFKNLNGFPIIYKYAFIASFGLAITIIQDRVLSYKIIKNSPTAPEELAEICKTEMNANKAIGYKKITVQHFNRSMLFANAEQLIKADIAEKLDGNDFEFFFNLEIDGPSCKWIAPIRAKPEKIYLGRMQEYSAEGAHIPYLLNKMLSSKSERDKKTLDIINNFGKNSGLFDAVTIKKFGKEVLAPFEVNIDFGNDSLVLGSVGYGVSQVLPIILEARRQDSNAYTAIQQPEVHLHPRAQAALGEFLFDCNSEKGYQYLIETHSDFLIDRFRLCMNKSENPKSAQVLFFERTSDGNKIYSIEIDNNGRYPLDQPDAFRAFFLNEEISLLKV